MPADPATIVKKTSRATFGQKAATFLLFLVEVLLPPLVSAAAIAWLFTRYNLWAMGAILSGILYTLAVVLLSLMLVVILDSFTAGARKTRGTFGRGALARLIKFALGGVIFPLALAISVLVVQLPGGKNLLTTVMGAAQSVIVSSPAQDVANLVVSSGRIDVKRSGIEVLGRMQNAEGLNALVALVKDHPELLRDGGTWQVMVQALSAYGAQSRDALVSLFTSIPASDAGDALADDLYGRYLSAGFEGLKHEITVTDPRRLEDLETARGQAEAELKRLQELSAGDSSGDLRPLFILQTFQAMNLSRDSEILALAMKTAQDPAYPSAVRGEALLLVGRLGGNDNIAALYKLSADADPLVQVRALQAASAILQKAGTKK